MYLQVRCMYVSECGCVLCDPVCERLCVSLCVCVRGYACVCVGVRGCECVWVCVCLNMCVSVWEKQSIQHHSQFFISLQLPCSEKILKDTAASETPRQRNLMRKTHSSMTLEVLALVVAAVVVVAAVAATSVSIISDSLTLVNNLFLLNVRTPSENKAGVKIGCSVFFVWNRNRTRFSRSALSSRPLEPASFRQPFPLSRLTSDGLAHLLNAKFQWVEI